jgi:hypothetical protein
MIIFYQIRSQLLKTVDVKNEACPLCKETGKLKLNILEKYMHLFGPINPLGKYAVLECDACDKDIPAKNWNDKLDAIYKKTKAETPTPKRLWRGAWVLGIVLGFIFGFGIIAQKYPELLDRHNTEQSSKDVNEKLNSVKEGDVLAIDFADWETVDDLKTMYGMIKIVKIEGDNVTIKEYSDRFGDLDFIDDLKKADLDTNKFSTEDIIVSLHQITKNKQVMQANGHSIGSHIYGFIN